MKKNIKKATTPSAPIAVLKSDNSYGWQWMLFIAAFLCYGLSVYNDYALDDFIVIVKNKLTQAGLSGIGSILSNDTFKGMTESNLMVLAGGRYRPLSVVTFAIEHQLFGNAPAISHFVNVLIYAFTGILLFKFLKQLLSYNTTDAHKVIATKAGLMALLFIVLPSHAEPVINIKGRDDLLCLFFFLLAALQLFKFIQTNATASLIYSALYYFFSLMSKETAITFVALFPAMLFFFSDTKVKTIIKNIAPHLFAACLFLVFRYLAIKDNTGAISNELLNDPFVFATTEQKYATIVLSWLLYLKLLVWPVHLSYDYNFNQIPLTNFSDWRVLFSIALHAALVLAAMVLAKRKSIYSFAIVFYFIPFSIFSNLFFNIGAVFAERFVYISSVGFCIAIVSGGAVVVDKLGTTNNQKPVRNIALLLFSFIVIVCTATNIKRCPEWKNNNTLFIVDASHAPQSAKVQLNAALAYMDLARNGSSTESDSLQKLAMDHLNKGIEIYPQYLDGYLNMGVIYSWKSDFVNAEKWWNKAREINPTHSALITYDKVLSAYYLKKGLDLGANKAFDSSIVNMHFAQHYDATNADIYYNLGGAHFSIQHYDSAKYYWQKAIALKPDFQQAINGINAIERVQGR